ncbi:MAG: hypothetical protein ABSD86_22985 [Candidatus Sulfotelmatobacter sp.]
MTLPSSLALNYSTFSLKWLREDNLKSYSWAHRARRRWPNSKQNGEHRALGGFAHFTPGSIEMECKPGHDPVRKQIAPSTRCSLWLRRIRMDDLLTNLAERAGHLAL